MMKTANILEHHLTRIDPVLPTQTIDAVAEARKIERQVVDSLKRRIASAEARGDKWAAASLTHTLVSVEQCHYS